MSNRLFRRISGGLALVSLALCLAAPVAYFLGRISEGSYRKAFLLASIAWFVLATARAMAADDRRSGG
jgi:ABC-type spermidine/putrescine transport system permease subunit I